MTRRTRITRRRRIFVGCEGESEQAYCQVLNDILNDQNLNLHLEVTLVGEGAGGPKQKVLKAIQKITHSEDCSGRFVKKVLFIDSDLVVNNPQGKLETEDIANKNGILLVWQEPTHEAFLLRHLPNCAAHRPLQSQLATNKLKAQWSEYKKPMPRMNIAKVIDVDRVKQAASVEQEFKSFLVALGWQL
jgi:hypothetical protein